MLLTDVPYPYRPTIRLLPFPSVSMKTNSVPYNCCNSQQSTIYIQSTTYPNQSQSTYLLNTVNKCDVVHIHNVITATDNQQLQSINQLHQTQSQQDRISEHAGFHLDSQTLSDHGALSMAASVSSNYITSISTHYVINVILKHTLVCILH